MDTFFIFYVDFSIYVARSLTFLCGCIIAETVHAVHCLPFVVDASLIQL